MLMITLEVDAPLGQAVGIKEDLAAHLERFGDVRVLSIKELEAKQVTLFQRRREEL